MPKPENRPPWIVSTLAEVAAFFDRRHQTVKGDWRANGMPGAAGKWDLKEILAWRRRNETDGQGAAAEGIDEETCIDLICQFTESILRDTDLLQVALKDLPREDRRALTIELGHFLVDKFADELDFDRDEVFHRLGIMEERQCYMYRIESLRQRLGIPEEGSL